MNQRWIHSVSKQPCLDCADRHAGCHPNCDRYNAWKAEVEQAKAEIDDKRVSEKIYGSYAQLNYKKHSK